MCASVVQARDERGSDRAVLFVYIGIVILLQMYNKKKMRGEGSESSPEYRQGILSATK